MLSEIENVRIKVARVVHKFPQNVLDHGVCEVLDCIKWQHLGSVFKRRLAIDVFKVKQGLNSRLIPFLTFVESKGLLLEVKRKNAALGRNSFAWGILCYGIQLIELQGTSRRQTL